MERVGLMSDGKFSSTAHTCEIGHLLKKTLPNKNNLLEFLSQKVENTINTWCSSKILDKFGKKKFPSQCLIWKWYM